MQFEKELLTKSLTHIIFLTNSNYLYALEQQID